MKNGEHGYGDTKARIAALVASLLLCAGFAAWPVTPAVVEPEPNRPSEPGKSLEVAALDMAAFRIPVWVAEPAPPPLPGPPSPAAPPPPLRIQLLAIIHETGGGVGGGAYKAAVYDIDADKILVVGSGEKIGSRSVDKVEPASLTLRDGAVTRTLSLKTGEGS